MKTLAITVVLLLMLAVQIKSQCVNSIKVELSQDAYDAIDKTYTYENVTYTAPHYYVQDDNRTYGCPCDVKLCVSYCCPLGERLLPGRKCTAFNQTNTLDIYDGAEFQRQSDDHYVFVNKESCDASIIDPSDNGTFFVQKDNGYLYADDKLYPHHRYCLTYFYTDIDQIQAVVCNDDEDVHDVHKIKTIGMIISIPFLLITFIVYILLNESNIGKKCQAAYVFCLMCAYIFLVYIRSSESIEPYTCLTLGSLCIYCFMSSFCWVNISCIDIFWTFSGKRGIQTRNLNNWRRFGCYTAYANGTPLLILGIIFGLNNEANKHRWFYPAFGIEQCFIGDGYPSLLYFYGPMGFLLTINVVLFVFTAMKIRQHQRETKVLRSDESKRHYDQNKQMYQLFIKLIIVMGINWIFEFISWCVDTILQERKIELIWIISDLCNALYGLVIFVLFICKRSVWISLKKKATSSWDSRTWFTSSNQTQTYQMSETSKGHQW